MTKCLKCGGAGQLSYHLNVDNGRCFACAGAGVVDVDTSAPRRVRTVAPATQESIRIELRNLYRAARSQRADGWGEDANDFDIAECVASNLGSLTNTGERSRVLESFRGVCSALAHARITVALTAWLAKWGAEGKAA